MKRTSNKLTKEETLAIYTSLTSYTSRHAETVEQSLIDNFEKSFHYDTESPFDIFNPFERRILKKAFEEYINRKMEPRESIERFLETLKSTCKHRLLQPIHVTLEDTGENVSGKSTKPLKLRPEKPFEFDIESCYECNLIKYNGEFKPSATNMDILKEISESGIRLDEISNKQTFRTQNFKQEVNAIKKALEIL